MTLMNKSINQRVNRIGKKLKIFEDLECWQACRDLRKFAAKACGDLLKAERYRLED